MAWTDDEDTSDQADARDEPDESDIDDSEEADLRGCPHCGKAIAEEAERCHHCGSYISAEDQPRWNRWWIVAGVALAALAVLLWTIR
jgi:predicted nucleic acid-binding Zn ribbon protein